jgi:hypothetical protein
VKLLLAADDMILVPCYLWYVVVRRAGDGEIWLFVVVGWSGVCVI